MKKMPFDYSKLSGKIVEVFGTRYNFAKAINRSNRTVSLKMNGKIEWTQDEMNCICQVLGISLSEIPEYFFALKVQ